MPNITLPYPSDWQKRHEYLVDRIMRLNRALMACRGRASAARPRVQREISRLRGILSEMEDRKAAKDSSLVSKGVQ